MFLPISIDTGGGRHLGDRRVYPTFAAARESFDLKGDWKWGTVGDGYWYCRRADQPLGYIAPIAIVELIQGT